MFWTLVTIEIVSWKNREIWHSDHKVKKRRQLILLKKFNLLFSIQAITNFPFLISPKIRLKLFKNPNNGVQRKSRRRKSRRRKSRRENHARENHAAKFTPETIPWGKITPRKHESRLDKSICQLILNEGPKYNNYQQILFYFHMRSWDLF